MKNAKTNTNAIVFAQANDSTKAVVANKYVAYALYAQNKALVEALGGEVIKGVDGFRAEFKTAKNAKAFIAQAICEMSTKDYNKARKTAPKVAVPATAKGKKTVAPTKAKGIKVTEYVTVHLADGTPLKVKASELMPMDKPAKKAKGKVEADKPTVAPNAKASKSVKAKAEPKKSKGNCKVDFSKLAGKGASANREAAALMRKAGLTDGKSAEYKAVWAEWCKVR
jgi:hypothetical protein